MLPVLGHQMQGRMAEPQNRLERSPSMNQAMEQSMEAD